MLNLYASLFCVVAFGLSWFILVGGKGAGAGERSRAFMGSRAEKVELALKESSCWERFNNTSFHRLVSHTIRNRNTNTKHTSSRYCRQNGRRPGRLGVRTGIRIAIDQSIYEEASPIEVCSVCIR